MNIFKLDNDPKLAARYHHNGHRKLILEAAQMLSTAVRVNLPNIDNSNIYKSSYVKHPCTLAVTNSKEIFQYVIKLGISLDQEFIFRSNCKSHKSVDVIKECAKFVDYIPNNWVEWPLAMPEKYKTKDAVLSYREYYINEKQVDKNNKWMMHYSPREIPYWIPNSLKLKIEQNKKS